ncbi:hypothetical protein [Nocardia colli]
MIPLLLPSGSMTLAGLLDIGCAGAVGLIAALTAGSHGWSGE